jgi:hypothetical protein
MINQFLFFVHIEKCAGTSLHRMLHNGYKGYCPLSPDFRDGQYFTAGQLAKLVRVYPWLQGVGGHRVRCYVNYRDAATGRQPFYFTFLRDLVSRYLSYFNYQNNVNRKGWDLDGYLDFDRFQDFQTFRIAGVRDLDAARHNLRDVMAFVGLMEEHDRCLLLMRSRLAQTKLDFRYEKANIGAHHGASVKFEDLTKSQKDRVLDRNRFDIELYEFAKTELVPRYIEDYVGDLEADLRQFRESLEGFRYSAASVARRKAKLFLVNVVLKLLLK